MGNFNIYPTTILGKVRTRTPTQAQSLSSRYVFLNVKNAEPNLGCPPDFYGGTYASSLTSEQYQGVRYALLSNNHSGSAWRVWAYDNPKIATYSKESSIALGDNAFPINFRSFVYSNYVYGNQNNRYNSQSFSRETFNVFSLSGIYLFNATTIGDPASAIEFIVTEEGKVGIGVEDPAEKLTVNGNISANGSLFVRDLSASSLTISGNISASGNLTINGNTVLGDTTSDETIIRGTVKIADSDSDALVFGTNNGSYDTNLYRSAADTLKTDDTLKVGTNLFVDGDSTLGDANTDKTVVNGKLGIGTNNPSEILTVVGGVSASGSLFIGQNTVLGDASTDQTTFNSFAAANASRSFTVGADTFTISMSSSEAILSNKNLFVLDVVNFPTQPFRTVFTDGGNFRSVTDPTMILGTNSDQHLRFRAGGSGSAEIRMTILSSGEVGIGTTLAETAAAGNGGLRIKNNLLVGGTATITGNISANGSINALSGNVGITVDNKTVSYTFTNSDNNKMVHFNTTTQSLCAIFPSTLRRDFNCGIMNTGTNSLVISAYSTLNAIGSSINIRYGGAFVYKDSSNNIYAVGRL